MSITSLSALYITMKPSQKDFGKTWVLAASFIAAGYSTAPGVIHLGYFMDESLVHGFEVFPWIVGGTIYAGGAVIYALKFPEKQFPGKFDIVGNSHNIFHVCCLIGALMHLQASVKMFHERQLYSCPVRS